MCADDNDTRIFSFCISRPQRVNSVSDEILRHSRRISRNKRRVTTIVSESELWEETNERSDERPIEKEIAFRWLAFQAYPQISTMSQSVPPSHLTLRLNLSYSPSLRFSIWLLRLYRNEPEANGDNSRVSKL